MTSSTFDYAIIGAGMAGASFAAELAGHAPAGTRIIVLEGEDRPGYHTTGRSAAFWEECYGGPDILPLTVASGDYLKEHGLLSPRGALYIARDEDLAAIEAFERRFASTNASFERVGRARLEHLIPRLRREWTLAIWQPDCADIDVAGLHQHYLKQAASPDVTLRTRFRVTAIDRQGDRWSLTDDEGNQIEARHVINAAGAWADTVAEMASVKPKSIAPMRRTVAQLRTNPQTPADLPLVLDINGGFYFRPDNGRLWLSPHDETPSEPCDAAPEELDIAMAIDRFEQVVDWRIEAVEHKWAGLRSFAPDRRPVYGPDPDDPTFLWFAGQGGFGIQTAPAAARLAVQVALQLPRDAMTEQLDASLYSPDRFV